MTTVVRKAPSALVGARLPRFAPLYSAAAAIAMAIGLKFAFGWTGFFTTLFSAGLMYLVALTAWSFTVEGRRRAKDRLAATIIQACFVAAVLPLLWILAYIAKRGLPALSAEFFTSGMAGVGPNDDGGGLAAALVGTIEQVGVAAVIALPLGLLTAIYLVEYGRGRFAKAVTFFVDVMTGVPSIVAGLFVYTFLLLGTGLRPFGVAGSVALALLMLPVVVRSSEEMLRLVPRELRDASYALGVPKWRTVLRVVLPTALSGLITSSLLAIARVAGETAPLILLVGYSDFINVNPFSGDQAALPMFVWDQLGKRSGVSGAIGGAWETRAWGAALTLVLLVLLLNISARLLSKLAQPSSK